MHITKQTINIIQQQQQQNIIPNINYIYCKIKKLKYIKTATKIKKKTKKQLEHKQNGWKMYKKNRKLCTSIEKIKNKKLSNSLNKISEIKYFHIIGVLNMIAVQENKNSRLSNQSIHRASCCCFTVR